MVKCRIVSLAEISAAHSMAPSDFLDYPCAQIDCDHGAGQHRYQFTNSRSGMPAEVLASADKRRRWKHGKDLPNGRCTAPGCKCTEYLDVREVVTGLA